MAVKKDEEGNVLGQLNVKLGITGDTEAMEQFNIYTEALKKNEEAVLQLSKLNTKWAKDGIEEANKYIKVLKEELNIQESLVEKITDKYKIADKANNLLKDLGFKTEASAEWQEMSKRGKAFAITGEVLKKSFSGLKKVLDISWENFGDILKSGLDTLKNIVDSSFLTNSKTRENVFSYGMTAGESYGFETAKSFMGISGMEDLMYMNEFQAQKFDEIMKKYTQKYNDLYDKGFFEKQLEFEISKKEFQQDVSMKVAEIFINNRDTIIAGMDALMRILDVTMKISNVLLGNANVSRASDVVSNYQNKNTNVKLDTTFNIQGEVTNDTINKIGQMNTANYLSMINNL